MGCVRTYSFEQRRVSGDLVVSSLTCYHAALFCVLYGGDSLFCFLCLIKTLSPRQRGVGFLFLFLSAYPFIFSFPFESFFVMLSCTGPSADLSIALGKLIFIFLPVQASKGDSFVVVWGVALYCRRKWDNWVFQSLPSTVVASINFFKVCIKRSTSSFASGHRGVIFLCLKPDWIAKSLKSCPWNGGPLSDFRTVGYPCLSKIMFRWGMTTCWQWANYFYLRKATIVIDCD